MTLCLQPRSHLHRIEADDPVGETIVGRSDLATPPVLDLPKRNRKAGRQVDVNNIAEDISLSKDLQE